VRFVSGGQRRRPGGGIALAALVALASTSCVAPGSSQLPTSSTTANAIVAEVASYQLVANQPGRLLVALLTADNLWVSFGSIAVSFAFLGDAVGSPAPGVVAGTTAPNPVMGDSTAEFLAIPGSPDGSGRQPTLTLPADGRGVYAVESITFPKAGYWQVVAHGKLGDASPFSADAAFTVLGEPSVLTVGALAPHTDNPVIGDPGVAPASIDSRAAGGAAIPDAALHTISIADALDAGHPALVVFSTPVYCVSRFCGPVTDLVAELAAKYGDRADFVHVEIYQDFEAGKVNEAAIDWLRPANGDIREPWTFLIGADGRIAASWDTVVTRGEIEPLLEGLPVK
jgi:hypothetical protein